MALGYVRPSVLAGMGGQLLGCLPPGPCPRGQTVIMSTNMLCAVHQLYDMTFLVLSIPAGAVLSRPGGALLSREGVIERVSTVIG